MSQGARIVRFRANNSSVAEQLGSSTVYTAFFGLYHAESQLLGLKTKIANGKVDQLLHACTAVVSGKT